MPRELSVAVSNQERERHEVSRLIQAIHERNHGLVSMLLNKAMLETKKMMLMNVKSWITSTLDECCSMLYCWNPDVPMNKSSKAKENYYALLATSVELLFHVYLLDDADISFTELINPFPHVKAKFEQIVYDRLSEIVMTYKILEQSLGKNVALSVCKFHTNNPSMMHRFFKVADKYEKKQNRDNQPIPRSLV